MTLYDSMVAQFRIGSESDRRNAEHEVMQQIALAGLERGGFFAHAAFYGGTCLRLLHGIDRFSEDMDFSLLEPDTGFRFEDFFPAVVEEFRLAGKSVEIKKKRKSNPTSIESAFLKESPEVFDIGFTTEKRLKVKIEVDVNPPGGFTTEMRVMQLPRNFLVRAYDLPGLFAGKASAALFRKWRNRVKGRDWYDLAWYIRQGARLDMAHLAERAKDLDETDISDFESLVAAFDARIEEMDIESAKNDVAPYVSDPAELKIWSREFFKEIIRRIRIKDQAAT